jgi:hypothetical protein
MLRRWLRQVPLSVCWLGIGTGSSPSAGLTEATADLKRAVGSPVFAGSAEADGW